MIKPSEPIVIGGDYSCIVVAPDRPFFVLACDQDYRTGRGTVTLEIDLKDFRENFVRRGGRSDES